jgi:2'-5' RNA ligase
MVFPLGGAVQLEALKQRAYLFVLGIEPMEIDKEYDSLPLRCTLMHWFKTGEGLEKVCDAAKQVFKDMHPITLEPEGRALFGSNNDIPVHIIAMSDDLHTLHSKLYEALTNVGVEYPEPYYVGNGWQPHVKAREENEFKSVTPSTIYLVEADAKYLTKKKVVAKFTLD